MPSTFDDRGADQDQRALNKAAEKTKKKKRTPKITDRRKELRDEIKVIEGGRSEEDAREPADTEELSSQPEKQKESKGFFSRFGKRKEEPMDSGEFTLGNPRERSTSEVIEPDIVSRTGRPTAEQARYLRRGLQCSYCAGSIAAPATDDAIQAARLMTSRLQSRGES